MAKRAVCLGLDDYDGHGDLRGCVNDSNDWKDILQEVYGFGDQVRCFTDADVTSDNVQEELVRLLKATKPGDLAVFTYSGHGTWVDASEEEENDFDEAVDECWYLRGGTLLKDDWLREALRKNLDPAAQLIMISDCCHAGTITRFIPKDLADGTQVEFPVANRYLAHRDGQGDSDREKPPSRGAAYPESEMREILLAGCDPEETSKEARINGRSNGAMTSTAIRLLRQSPQITYRELHQQILGLVQGRFDQTPQLEGQDAKKDRPVFSEPERFA